MKCIDLFSGCGGMSLGFSRANYKIVAAYDNWSHAVKCYEKNFTSHPICNFDLSKWEEAVKVINKLQYDIIIGGPPCQDFSDAGNRVEGQRAKLTICFANIVTSLKPNYFVMENVSRAKNSIAYSEAKKILKNAGYGLTEQLLDASLCNVPQKRKRFFCIGSLNHKDGFMRSLLTANLSEIPLTVKEYLKDEIDIEYYYRHPRTYRRRGIFSVSEPAPTVRGCNRPMPQNYKPHDNDAAKPNGIRALTVNELARVQTFPSNFQWPDAQNTATQLIGNAVPVNLAHYVASGLSDFISGNYDDTHVNFIEWLICSKKYTPNVAKDMLSRYRRVISILRPSKNQQNLEDRLSQTKDFQSLSSGVKSQLKKACVLHHEYMSIVGNRNGRK